MPNRQQMYVIIDSAFRIAGHFKVSSKPFYFLKLASGEQWKQGGLRRRKIRVSRLQRDHKLV
jgi:hypothetical protein